MYLLGQLMDPKQSGKEPATIICYNQNYLKNSEEPVKTT